jgi:hypothetical protein
MFAWLGSSLGKFKLKPHEKSITSKYNPDRIKRF